MYLQITKDKIQIQRRIILDIFNNYVILIYKKGNTLNDARAYTFLQREPGIHEVMRVMP